MKKTAIFTILALLLTFSSAFAKIGVFSFQEVLSKSKKGQEAAEVIKAKYAKLGKELEAQYKEIKEKEEAFKKQYNSLKPEARDQKQLELNKIANSFEEQKKFNGKEFDRFQQKQINEIRDDIVKIINKLGKELGYDAIFEAQNSGVIYVDEKVDITNIVIERYNREK